MGFDVKLQRVPGRYASFHSQKMKMLVCVSWVCHGFYTGKCGMEGGGVWPYVSKLVLVHSLTVLL